MPRRVLSKGGQHSVYASESHLTPVGREIEACGQEQCVWEGVALLPVKGTKSVHDSEEGPGKAPGSALTFILYWEGTWNGCLHNAHAKCWKILEPKNSHGDAESKADKNLGTQEFKGFYSGSVLAPTPWNPWGTVHSPQPHGYVNTSTSF